jgi:hypothetical protein
MTKSFGVKLILAWSARILLASAVAALVTIATVDALDLSLSHKFFIVGGLIFGLVFGVIIGKWWAGLVLALPLGLIFWDDPIFRFLSGSPYFTGISNGITGFDEDAERVFGIFIAASVTSLISGYLVSLAMRLKLDKFSRPYKGHVKESETLPS